MLIVEVVVAMSMATSSSTGFMDMAVTVTMCMKVFFTVFSLKLGSLDRRFGLISLTTIRSRKSARPC